MFLSISEGIQDIVSRHLRIKSNKIHWLYNEITEEKNRQQHKALSIHKADVLV